MSLEAGSGGARVYLLLSFVGLIAVTDNRKSRSASDSQQRLIAARQPAMVFSLHGWHGGRGGHAAV